MPKANSVDIDTSHLRASLPALPSSSLPALPRERPSWRSQVDRPQFCYVGKRGLSPRRITDCLVRAFKEAFAPAIKSDTVKGALRRVADSASLAQTVRHTGAQREQQSLRPGPCPAMSPQSPHLAASVISLSSPIHSRLLACGPHHVSKSRQGASPHKNLWVHRSHTVYSTESWAEASVSVRN